LTRVGDAQLIPLMVMGGNKVTLHLMKPRTFKIIVKAQRREDGGVRVWSDHVPGLVLSGRDPERVLADIEPALKAILEARLHCKVNLQQLEPMPELPPVGAPEAEVMPEAARMPPRSRGTIPAPKRNYEYAAAIAA